MIQTDVKHIMYAHPAIIPIADLGRERQLLRLAAAKHRSFLHDL